MRIAIVAPDGLPPGSRARREARTLAAAGHQVTCYGTFDRGDPSQEPEEDDGQVVLVRVCPLPAPTSTAARLAAPIAGLFQNPSGSRRFAPLLAVAATRDCPEAIHALGLECASQALDATRRSGVPVVYDEAGALASWLSADGGEGDRLRSRVRWLLDDVVRADLGGCVAGSDAAAWTLAPRLVRGVPAPVVLRNLPRRRTTERTETLRRRLGLWVDERIVVFHGPLGTEGGVETAIRSLVHVDQPCVLAVIGAAWCEDRIRGIAESTGVATRVRLLPRPQDDAETLLWIASAEAIVFPGAPAAAGEIPPEVLDAVHAGTPIVAAPGTEAARLVVGEGLGVVARAASPESIAAALRTVFLWDESTSSVARRALAKSRDRLSWETESLRLVDLYDRLGGG